MKYKSISLNGTDKYQYSLVKYEKKYNDIIKQLKTINVDLLNSVLQCPKIYSEESEHQAYMIVKGDDIGVGATYIGTSCDEKDLEVTLQLDEEKFDDDLDMYKFIEQLVDSLGRYFYEKNNVYINLINKIDLSKYNGFKYKREYHYMSMDTYCCSNKKYNEIIPLILKEIKNCEDTLVSWRQTWLQSLEHVDYSDLHYLYDENHLNEMGIPKKYMDVPIDEMFNKVDTVTWSNINSKTSEREITFNVDGDVRFSKRTKNPNGNSYKFSYNVLRDGFKLKSGEISFLNSKNNIEVKNPNLEISKDKEENKVSIKYISPVVNNRSLFVQALIRDNLVEKCYVDYRIHKMNGKIKRMYLLRENAGNYNVNYRTKKGDVSRIYGGFIPSGKDIESVNALMDKTTDAVNYIDENAFSYTTISDLINCVDIIDLLKNIKGEIPLPYLQEQIENFISEFEYIKENGKVKKLQ